jgi:2,4-dienoyl-CoA reductase-like NADH-dependent reductase (Old Yellow Enzyme family)
MSRIDCYGVPLGGFVEEKRTADVFEPAMIGKMRLSNRFVRSATYEGLADGDGRVTGALVDLYGELAEGGIGLIVVGYAYVQPNGKGAPGMLGIYSDEHTEGLAQLVDAVHARGQKIASQIVHCGRQTFEELIGGQAVGPSPVQARKFGATPRELTAAEIAELTEDFARAAARAKAAQRPFSIHTQESAKRSATIIPFSSSSTAPTSSPAA